MGANNKSWDQGFSDGVLYSASILNHIHDCPVMAADLLNEAGLADADCSHLDDFDKNNLKKIQGELGGRIRLKGLGR